MNHMDPDPAPRGLARTRILAAARDVIRRRGYAAATVDAICAEAGVTKGAFFHHFASKDDLAVAAAAFWSETTGAFFAQAPYHAAPDPLARVLAYLDFRAALIVGEIAEWTCLAGTMVQETYREHPAIREACAAAIFDHAQTLEADIAAAMAAHGLAPSRTLNPAGLARHIQAVLQGAFVLAKAAGDPAIARESIGHLKRYVRLIFGVPDETRDGTRED